MGFVTNPQIRKRIPIMSPAAATVRRMGGSEPPAGAAEELFERFGHRETWRVYPDVAGTLSALASRGVPMAVVSNWDSRLPALLRELGIRHYFGPILVSALEGYEKPDPRIFHLAAERAGVEPRQVLHAGDRDLEDLEGARRSGCLGAALPGTGCHRADHPRGGPALSVLPYQGSLSVYRRCQKYVPIGDEFLCIPLTLREATMTVRYKSDMPRIF